MKLEGEIKELPYELRKLIYEEITKMDFEEHDVYIKKQQDKGGDAYAATYETDVPGLKFMIGPDNIVVSVVMLIQETGEKKPMIMKFPRGEEHILIEDKP